jgi:hypothetical protein
MSRLELRHDADFKHRSLLTHGQQPTQPEGNLPVMVGPAGW